MRGLVGGGAEFSVPDRPELGHLSASAAFRIAKEEKTTPLEAARRLAEKAKSAAPAGLFDKIEAAAPGFVNFWLSKDALRAEVRRILADGDEYGRAAASGKKIQIEFVSANPTGPLTLANGRGGFLGDALASAMEYAGDEVEREYYANDTGNQVLTLGKSLFAAAGKIPDEENFYKGGYIKEWAGSHAAAIAAEADPLALGKAAARDFLAGIKRVLGASGIRFDRWTSEDEAIRQKGYVEKAKALFREKGLSYEAEGAVWLKTTGFGDDKDRVIITSDGFPTYFLADAGHYLETVSRGFRKKILILGPDHYGYVKRIQAVAQVAGLEESSVIITQAVRLVDDGREVKMSKRRGEFITFEDLVEEVGPDVARYFFLQSAPETHMDFDMKLAKERSEKNPVYYLQYAAVRAKGILGKAGAEGAAEAAAGLDTDVEFALIRTLAEFPQAVRASAKHERAHSLTHYASRLARAFHAFYELERVAGEEKKIAEARAALVRASLAIFSSLFKIIGISEPEKM